MRQGINQLDKTTIGQGRVSNQSYLDQVMATAYTATQADK